MTREISRRRKAGVSFVLVFGLPLLAIVVGCVILIVRAVS